MPKLKYNDGTGFKQIVPTKEEFDSHLDYNVQHQSNFLSNKYKNTYLIVGVFLM